MSRIYTMRGTMGPTETTRSLVVDDGRYTHGYVIQSVQVWPSAITLPAGFNVNAVLSVYEDAPLSMNAEETGTFAWAAYIEDTTTGGRTTVVLDPQHVVNQDMFIHNLGGTAMNYMITMLPITMSPEQGVLQLVKAVNQS